MQKDIFNGNIKQECIVSVKISLILGTATYFLISLVFFVVALLDKHSDQTAIVTMFVLSGICLLAAVIFLFASLFAIRTYPKHPKLAKSLLKPYVFRDYTSDGE